jgi:hypothetical protein
MATKAKKSTAATKAKANGGPRKGSALAKVAGMLRRPGGCTREQVLKATKWSAVSMQQQAKAAGVKLKIDKSERPFTYRAI